MKISLWVLVDNDGRICYSTSIESHAIYQLGYDAFKECKLIELKGEC